MLNIAHMGIEPMRKPCTTAQPHYKVRHATNRPQVSDAAKAKAGLAGRDELATPLGCSQRDCPILTPLTTRPPRVDNRKSSKTHLVHGRERLGDDVLEVLSKDAAVEGKRKVGGKEMEV